MWERKMRQESSHSLSLPLRPCLCLHPAATPGTSGSRIPFIFPAEDALQAPRHQFIFHASFIHIICPVYSLTHNPLTLYLTVHGCCWMCFGVHDVCGLCRCVRLHPNPDHHILIFSFSASSKIMVWAVDSYLLCCKSLDSQRDINFFEGCFFYLKSPQWIFQV